jgi:hypothetical protein
MSSCASSHAGAIASWSIADIAWKHRSQALNARHKVAVRTRDERGVGDHLVVWMALHSANWLQILHRAIKAAYCTKVQWLSRE